MASCTNSRLPALSDRGDLDLMRQNLILLKENEKLKEFQNLHFEDASKMIEQIDSLTAELANQQAIIAMIGPENRQLVATVEDQRKALQRKDEQLEDKTSANELLRAEIERLMMILQTIQ